MNLIRVVFQKTFKRCGENEMSLLTDTCQFINQIYKQSFEISTFNITNLINYCSKHVINASSPTYSGQ